jgi:hypothetical protein
VSVGDEQNGHGMSRLDRMEGLMQLLIDDHLKFTDDHKLLLTAQVLQDERIDKLVAAQNDTQERLNALILTVDDLIRRLPA